MNFKQLTFAAAMFAATSMASAAELKLADFQPPTHFVVKNVYDPFAAQISEKTSGGIVSSSSGSSTAGSTPCAVAPRRSVTYPPPPACADAWSALTR